MESPLRYSYSDRDRRALGYDEGYYGQTPKTKHILLAMLQELRLVNVNLMKRDRLAQYEGDAYGDKYRRNYESDRSSRYNTHDSDRKYASERDSHSDNYNQKAHSESLTQNSNSKYPSRPNYDKDVPSAQESTSKESDTLRKNKA
jgi:hypothetical protein